MSEITQKSSAHFSTAALALLESVGWDENNEEDEERRRRGEGSAGGGGGPSVKDIIKSVRGSWKHLIGSQLLATLKEFGASTRASANMMVSWTGDFTIIQDIFDEIEEQLFGKERERKRDWWKRWHKQGKTAKPVR
jgi:hypothetical protein